MLLKNFVHTVRTICFVHVSEQYYSDLQLHRYVTHTSVFKKKKKTPWPESVSELY
jgi:hypothetical protein